jgi:predicted nucleotidyltransferase
MSRESDLALAKQIVLSALRPYHAQVYLFGSQATNRATPLSDIDIAVESAVPFPSGVMAALREALEESNVVRQVDLIDLAEVSPAFRERVRQEAIAWTD